MPRPRFDRLPAERRREVLATAAEEFVAHGYHAASLNRVHKALGLSKGAFYYWFVDKEDLFVAVLDAQLAAMACSVGGLLTGPPDPSPLWNQVERCCADLLAYVLERPHVLALYKAAVALPMGSADRVGQRLAASIAATRALVEEGQRRGDVRTDLPAELLSHVAHGVLEGMDRFLFAAADVGEGVAEHTPGQLAAVYVSLLERVLLPG